DQDQPIVRRHARQAPPRDHRRPIFTRTAPRPLPTENQSDPASLNRHARLNRQSRALENGSVAGVLGWGGPERCRHTTCGPALDLGLVEWARSLVDLSEV